MAKFATKPSYDLLVPKQMPSRSKSGANGQAVDITR